MVTVSAARICCAAFEPPLIARMISIIPVLTTNSSPCWLAMNITGVGPSPIVATGMSRPVLDWSGAGSRLNEPWARRSIDLNVLQSCS